MKPTAAFIFNLVQDVAVLRPLVEIAVRDFGFRALILISSKLSRRDPGGIWQQEIDLLGSSAAIETHTFNSAFEAVSALEGSGILFAASESHLPNHSTTHEIFRSCPSSYLRVTLQHGFECVGFLHSENHVRAHGETASFGADYICAWSSDGLKSLSPSQRSKLIVTGSTAILQQPQGAPYEPVTATGLVCENLHSVRFRGPGQRVQEFVHAFVEFCSRMGQSSVALRPHPGGQYIFKNRVEIPTNAYIENSPAYRLDFRQFRYGISAPSSVLIDMLLANIPTAVWRDGSGAIDRGNYAGLATVSSPEEWAEFARSAIADPAPFLEQQRHFLEKSGMLTDPAEVYSRFAALFEAALRRESKPLGSMAQRHRLQFIANSRVPTLQLSFEKPLAGPIARGEVVTDLVTEQEIRGAVGPELDQAALMAWVRQRLDEIQPTALIFCRYSGPGASAMVRWAHDHNIPIIYHIDDDLLAIPSDIGERKFALHNAPERLEAVRSLLLSADLVYCSTEALMARLLGYFPNLPVTSGEIYASGEILRSAEVGDEIVVGYMASADHAHNLDLILPAIERLLDARDHVRFELFGSIPVPPALKRFGQRVSSAPPVADYDRFLDEFASRNWDVGLCPLVKIDFNLMKANTKWVEYSSAGAAVVASRGTVYDRCCSDGCGILADGVEEWFQALDHLVSDHQSRLAQVMRAQDRLGREYSLERLREQVFDVIARAHQQAGNAQRPEILEKVDS